MQRCVNICKCICNCARRSSIPNLFKLECERDMAGGNTPGPRGVFFSR